MGKAMIIEWQAKCLLENAKGYQHLDKLMLQILAKHHILAMSNCLRSQAGFYDWMFCVGIAAGKIKFTSITQGFLGQHTFQTSQLTLV